MDLNPRRDIENAMLETALPEDLPPDEPDPQDLAMQLHRSSEIAHDDQMQAPPPRRSFLSRLFGGLRRRP